MKSKNQWWLPVVMLSLIGLAAITLIRITSAAEGNGISSQQDIIRLENRLTQPEHRIYSIENSTRTLEQQTRLSGGSSRGVTPEEVALIHSEIQLLQRRIIEDECGLAKLDERTLSPEGRRRGATSNDPCRLNYEAPLRLPER